MTKVCYRQIASYGIDVGDPDNEYYTKMYLNQDYYMYISSRSRGGRRGDHGAKDSPFLTRCTDGGLLG